MLHSDESQLLVPAGHLLAARAYQTSVAETAGMAEPAELPASGSLAWPACVQTGAGKRSIFCSTQVLRWARGRQASAPKGARALSRLKVIGTASRPETVEFARRMGAHEIVDHRRPLGPQLAEVAPGGVNYVFSTTGTARNLPAYAEALTPFGAIVAIDDPDALPLGVLKPKSISFHWEFMFTRSMFATPDQQEQHRILTQVAYLADEDAIVSTATTGLGPINAGNLREAHRLQASGTTIGKLTLTGF